MSDEGETFLGRWSKRKVQARRRPRDAESESEAGLSHQTGAQNTEPEEIPLEDLPPIESIDASTDLSPWLRQRVPDAWRQAALKRVWTSDPAISQFIGLAENSWDWNATDGVPGFGPLSPSHNVADLLARVIGELPKGDAPETVETTATPATVEGGEPSVEGPAEPQSPTPIMTASPEHKGLPPILQETPCAEEAAASTEQLFPKRRRGGGALPQ
jgi:hypothetical protein